MTFPEEFKRDTVDPIVVEGSSFWAAAEGKRFVETAKKKWALPRSKVGLTEKSPNHPVCFLT